MKVVREVEADAIIFNKVNLEEAKQMFRDLTFDPRTNNWQLPAVEDNKVVGILNVQDGDWLIKESNFCMVYKNFPVWYKVVN